MYRDTPRSRTAIGASRDKMGSAMRPPSSRDVLAFPSFTPARRTSAESVIAALRSGEPVTDESFDAIYPFAVSAVSCAHWTPVRVAVRIVELLHLRRDERLLDVGAGVGKFCVVAAARSGAGVRGVERRPDLASVGREAARRYGVDVDIALGSFEAEDPRAFDAVYVFNPFTEEIALEGVDDDALDAERAVCDVSAAERFLEAARPGMRLVTFCGFGGNVPSAYEQEAKEVWDEGALELWVKRR